MRSRSQLRRHVDVGVGRRGRTETYVECQPSLLADEHSPYLWLLYSAEALVPDGSLHEILEESQRFAGDLAERLRERIYDHVIPKLARGIADARGIDRPQPQDLTRTYEMAFGILARSFAGPKNPALLRAASGVSGCFKSNRFADGTGCFGATRNVHW